MTPTEASPPELSSDVFWLAVGAVGAGIVAAVLLRARHRKHTWMLLPLMAAVPAHAVNSALGDVLLAFGSAGLAVGGLRHRAEVRAGADLVQLAASRIGPFDALRGRLTRRQAHRGEVLNRRGLLVGVSTKGPVRIPAPSYGGTHTLVLGATGSGKTITQGWMATALIRAGHGAIVVDPKGDRALRDALADAAIDTDAEFVEWTPHGPSIFNPYARGADSEIVDKLLAGEVYTEPHYLRQAQRYLGHLVTALRATGSDVSLASVVEHYDRDSLELLSRNINDQGSLLERYLSGLGADQEKQLRGTLDRLAILHEGDLGPWLDPSTPGQQLDLGEIVRRRSVAYFALEADRHPLHAQMLGTAIVQDLIALTAQQHADPVPTVVVLDEFGALAAQHVTRLFGRGRSAGFSLVLGTQELADLTAAGDGLLERVLGNVETVIAHRQNVPTSAELVANIAGTYGTWATTRRTDHWGALPDGTATRERQYRVHPDEIKHLPRGNAAVLIPSKGAHIANIFPVPQMLR